MRKLLCVLLFLVACAPVELPEVVSTPTPQPETVQEPEPTVKPAVVPKIKAPEVKVAVEQPDECETFGCPGAKIVADMEMDLFYECHCARARWIKPDFILCFASEEEAVGRGYRKAQSC